MPELWVENVPAYLAFDELTLERITGFSEGPIPRSVVRQYAIDEGLDVDELIRKVRALDMAYLDYRQKQREREKETERRRANTRPGNPRRR